MEPVRGFHTMMRALPKILVGGSLAVMVLDFLHSGRVLLRVYSLRKHPRDSDAQAIQDPIYAEFLR